MKRRRNLTISAVVVSWSDFDDKINAANPIFDAFIKTGIPNGILKINFFSPNKYIKYLVMVATIESALGQPAGENECFVQFWASFLCCSFQ